jgi:hypothetical protein
MFSDLTPGIVLAILGITLYKVLELYARRTERLRVIEKLSEIQSENKEFKFDLSFNNKSSFSSIRIGLLLIGVGLGALVGILLQTSCTDSLSLQFNKFDDAVQDNISNLVGLIYFASISTFGGVGLVFAYLIEKREKNNG